MTDRDTLTALIERFVDGTDISISAANAIESALDDAFPDDELMQDTVLMLASYRPGGGPYLFAEDEVKHQFRKVLSVLRR